MSYIFNYRLFVEKQSIMVAPPNPIEGGVVLILSKPFPDGNRKLIMRIISKIINNEKAIGVFLKHDLYILKEFDNGVIMPDGLYLDEEQRVRLLGMKTNSLFLNNKKTPLWVLSTTMIPRDFFKFYQQQLKELQSVNNFEYPKTQRKLPNL